MPKHKEFEPPDYNGVFNYQMLFTDGNRIDLTFTSLENAVAVVENDPVGIVLLDKDGVLNNIKFSGPEIYFVSPPTKKAFENSCNSFWWVLQNVAKGINGKEREQAINDVATFLAEWLSKYGSLLKIPLWYILYNNRR